jgi:hypothetical protein
MSQSKCTGLGLLATSIALGACTGGSGGTPPSDAGVTGTPADTGGAGEGASGVGPGSCVHSPDAGGLPYFGVVELSKATMPPAAPRFAAIGEFETAASQAPGGCTGTMVGACCFENTAAKTPTPVSAGTITITDGAKTLGTLTPPVYVTGGAGFAWMPGASLTVTSSGATIDAFTATVVAPDLFMGVSPPFAMPITVPLKANFVVSWTPSPEPCSVIDFGFSQGSLMPHIDCVVDDTAGTLTVPAALLGMITAKTGTAILERVEGKNLATANASIGVVALNVLTTTTTYTP